MIPYLPVSTIPFIEPQLLLESDCNSLEMELWDSRDQVRIASVV